MAHTENQKSIYQWSGKRILIVEDDLITYKYFTIVLKNTGAQIFHAENGEQALKYCRGKQSFDLILMDIQLPVMDGYTATREIKAICPGIPVIAQTAYALEAEEHRCRMAGCDEYLAKPFRKDELLSLMDKYLSPQP
jgi:two-component system cell cycle response regulator DivK